VLQLGQLQKVALQGLGVLIHLPQLVLQLLKGGLKGGEGSHRSKHVVSKQGINKQSNIKVGKAGNGNFCLYLQVDHLSGLRSLRTLPGVQHGYAVLLDLLLQVAQLALHFIATTHFIDELPLKGVHIRI